MSNAHSPTSRVVERSSLVDEIRKSPVELRPSESLPGDAAAPCQLQTEAPRPHGEQLHFTAEDEDIPAGQTKQGEVAGIGVSKEDGPVIEKEHGESRWSQSQQQHEQQHVRPQQHPIAQGELATTTPSHSGTTSLPASFASPDLKLLSAGHGDPSESVPATIMQERIVASGLAEHHEPAVVQGVKAGSIDYVSTADSAGYQARVAMESHHPHPHTDSHQSS